MFHVLRLCYMYWGYVTCTEAMLHVLRLCYMHWGYVTCTEVMLHVPKLCYMYWGYVTCTEAMLQVLRLCYMYWGYVTCTEAIMFLTIKAIDNSDMCRPLSLVCESDSNLCFYEWSYALRHVWYPTAVSGLVCTDPALLPSSIYAVHLLHFLSISKDMYPTW